MESAEEPVAAVAADAEEPTKSKPKYKEYKTPQELLEHIPIGHPDSMMSKESVRKAVEEFETKPTDVIVATFPKTGTTMITWICHLMRTGARPSRSLGNGDSLDDDEKGGTFETIYELVPWPTLSWDIGYDPNVQGSEFHPRVFKSHLRMASIYPGCKYVVTIRDPAWTTLSFYNSFIAKKVPFLVSNNKFFPLMDVSTFLMDTPFVKGNYPERASIWEYYAEYHALLECPSVLMIIYEDFVADKHAHIRTLARFLDIPERNYDQFNSDYDSDDCFDLIERTRIYSSKQFMARHMSKFDEPYERAKSLNRAADVSQLAPGAKVALEYHQQTFDDRAIQFLEDQWKATMCREPLGYEDYEDFCCAVRARNERWFGESDSVTGKRKKSEWTKWNEKMKTNGTE